MFRFILLLNISINRKMKNIIIYTIPKTGTHLVSDIIALMINPNTDIYRKEKMYEIVPHTSRFLKNKTIMSTHPTYI
mgnify:CR=1 FL=1